MKTKFLLLSVICVILSELTNVTGLQCYRCDNCTTVKEEHLVTCGSTATSTTTTTTTSTTTTTTTTAAPNVTTIAPNATTTVAPNVTTIAPNATTTVAPNVTTIAPNATTTVAPNVTTIAPNATTTVVPNVTTIAPNATTTVAPNATTTVASNTTTTVASNETTTIAPNTTTTVASNETTTVAPNATTTIAPNATTTAASNDTATIAPITMVTTTDAINVTNGTSAALMVQASRVKRAAGENSNCICQNEKCDCSGQHFMQSRAEADAAVTYVCVKDTSTVNGQTYIKRDCAVQYNQTTTTCTTASLSANCTICNKDKCNGSITYKFSSVVLFLSIFSYVLLSYN